MYKYSVTLTHLFVERRFRLGYGIAPFDELAMNHSLKFGPMADLEAFMVAVVTPLV